MNKKILTVALIGSTFFTSITAFAGPGDQRDDGDRHEYHQQGRPDQGRPDSRRSGPDRDHNQHNARDNHSHQDWKRGQRVPDQYKNSRYYVNDWKSRSLPTPPRGHRWINVNGDYILVAITTGIISSILLNHR